MINSWRRHSPNLRMWKQSSFHQCKMPLVVLQTRYIPPVCFNSLPLVCSLCIVFHELKRRITYIQFASDKGRTIQESCQEVCRHLVLRGKSHTRSHILRYVLGRETWLESRTSQLYKRWSSALVRLWTQLPSEKCERKYYSSVSITLCNLKRDVPLFYREMYFGMKD